MISFIFQLPYVISFNTLIMSASIFSAGASMAFTYSKLDKSISLLKQEMELRFNQLENQNTIDRNNNK